MKKMFFMSILAFASLLVFSSNTFAQADQCIVGTTQDGYRYWVLIGHKVLEREKAVKTMDFNDYKAYKEIKVFDDQTPTNVALSADGKIGYVSAIDDATAKVGYLYKFVDGVESNLNWGYSSTINGLATNYDGSRLLIIANDNKLYYRNGKGNYKIIRTFAGSPTTVAMSSNGEYAYVVTGESDLCEFTYDQSADKYVFKKMLEVKGHVVLGVSSNQDSSKLWIITSADYGYHFALMEGDQDGNFKKLYTFDDTSYPWNVVLSADGRMAYIPLSFNYILRFAYDHSAKCYVVYRILY